MVMPASTLELEPAGDELDADAGALEACCDATSELALARDPLELALEVDGGARDEVLL